MFWIRTLHKINIMHRDLKPKNIFLTAHNQIRLGDLGCAKVMKAGMARTQIGTPYYMSPEIWEHKSYNAASDMWALGCIVFEMCSGRPPFLANDMQGLARKVRFKEGITYKVEAKLNSLHTYIYVHTCTLLFYICTKVLRYSTRYTRYICTSYHKNNNSNMRTLQLFRWIQLFLFIQQRDDHC
jgi:serine/threonine protein kinase